MHHRQAVGRLLDRYEMDTRIVEYVALHPEATIELIAKETGLSYTAVRNSLHRLVQMGVLEEQPTQHPGRRGRPALRFRLRKGLHIRSPPRCFEHLATILLDQIIHDEGEEGAQLLLKRAGKLHATRLYQTWKNQDPQNLPATPRTCLERICQEYNRLGGYAQLTEQNNILAVQVRNCVYSELAGAYPGVICTFHTSFMTHLLRLATKNPHLTVTHASCMAKGDPHCQFNLTQPTTQNQPPNPPKTTQNTNPNPHNHQSQPL